MTRLILLIAIILQFTNAQLVGPTFTPTDTATYSNPRSTTTATPKLITTDSYNLGSSTPTLSASQTTFIFVSGCGDSCNKTSFGIGTSSQSPIASESSQVQSDNQSNDNHKKNTIIIAISVSAGVLLIIISFLICFFYRRKRQRENSFNYNTSSLGDIGAHKNTKEDETVKTYNVSPVDVYRSSNDDNKNNSNIIPPVIMYTDVMKQSEQQDGKPSARLSKYNFLAHMFTQMKESYSLGAMVLAQDSVNKDDTIQSQRGHSPVPEKFYSDNQSPSLDYENKNSVRNVDQNIQLQNFQENHPPYPINQDQQLATSSNSLSTSPLPESGRESTTTVGTLHAPLFKNNGLYPPTPSKTKLSSSPILNKQATDIPQIPNSNSKRDFSNSNHTNVSKDTRTFEKTGSSRPYNFF